MVGIVIPGPLGGEITLRIDGGTLMRAVSLPIGPTGIDDFVVEWARRQIREGAGRLLRYAGEVAYRAAMLEIAALGNDVQAKLALISQLPDDIKNQVAYEAFATAFTHYLPKRFLRQYVWGRGGRITLTLQEMKDCNPHVTLLQEPAFVKLLDDARLQPGRAFPFEMGIPSAALTNGTLGQFTTLTRGMLVAGSDGTWSATGTMQFSDTWDFDPKDWKTGGRTTQGEIKTRVGNIFLPGQGFPIDSETTPFSQSQRDSTVVWAGGAPRLVPDRIAAADVFIRTHDQ